jgi:hypothetical protein
MMQIFQTLLRLVPHQGAQGDALDRSERDTSYDRALAAFKADLEERAVKNTRHIPGEWQSRRS